MRPSAALVAALAVLALPAAASAKEVSEVAVCGNSKKCVTYDKSDFKSLMFLAHDAGPTDPPASAAPWYRIRFTVDEREHGGGYARWSVAYVPSADVIRVRDDYSGFAWVALNRRAARTFGSAARKLPPFPATSLRGLHPKPVEAQVDHVVQPPPAAAVASGSGSFPWGWIAGALGALAVLAALARTSMLAARRAY
jgi:hypothetical protein